MIPWQERVVEEKKELDIKIGKLIVFMDVNSIFQSLDVKEKSTLREQLGAMNLYSYLLGERIDRFETLATGEKE